MSFKNTYSALALSLMLTGAALIVLSYIVLRSIPLTSLGISTVIIGAVASAIARGQPKIPPEASAILLQSGAENVSAIIEEIGLKSKAIYLPSSISGDKPKALIPLDSELDFGSKVLPKRLIVKYGSKPGSIGLLVITPGSATGSMVEAKPNSTAGELESDISKVLSGTVNLADGVHVKMDGDKILVEVTNPRLENSKMGVYESLGSPIASIVASIVAEVLDKPVSIVDEHFSRGKALFDLKVVEANI